MVLGHVVVVALESTARDPDETGEGVQFVETLVTDEVTPALPAPPPPALVDQHRHGAITTAVDTERLPALSTARTTYRSPARPFVSTNESAFVGPWIRRPDRSTS